MDEACTFSTAMCLTPLHAGNTADNGCPSGVRFCIGVSTDVQLRRGAGVRGILPCAAPGRAGWKRWCLHSQGETQGALHQHSGSGRSGCGAAASTHTLAKGPSCQEQTDPMMQQHNSIKAEYRFIES